MSLLWPMKASSRASSCGLTSSHAVPPLMSGREKINSKGIKWLPICEHPVLICLLISGSSSVLELSLIHQTFHKRAQIILRRSWEGGECCNCGGRAGNVVTVGSHPHTLHADPHGTLSSRLLTALVSLIKMILIKERLSSGVYSQPRDFKSWF